MELNETVIIPVWAQGRTGMGQGGYTAGKFCQAIGQPVSIALKAPTPLETEMNVVATGEGWELKHGDQTIMGAIPSGVDYATTAPVSETDAASASQSFAGHVDHKAPHCLSCGTNETSMHVWPGRLSDGTGRFATPWTPPAWAGDGTGSGVVDPAYVWMALDCTCGFFVDGGPDRRDAVTVQYAVEILRPIRIGETYVNVGFDGDWTGGWDGRKRGASACVFDRSGTIVAQATSFWVALD